MRYLSRAEKFVESIARWVDEGKSVEQVEWMLGQVTFTLRITPEGKTYGFLGGSQVRMTPEGIYGAL